MSYRPKAGPRSTFFPNMLVPVPWVIRHQLLSFVIMLACVTLLLVSSSFAHSWYDPECCKSLMEEGGDCRPVPCKDVKRLADGGVSYRRFEFRGSQVRDSKDADCHACFNTSWGYCVYLPPST